MSISWTTLQRASRGDSAAMDQMRRSPEVEEKYMKRKNDLEERGLDISDFIHKRLFADAPHRWAFTTNQFPYDTKADHWLLWKNRDLDPNDYTEEMELHEEICKHIKVPFILLDRSTRHRTVPGVRHYHIFTQKAHVD